MLSKLELYSVKEILLDLQAEAFKRAVALRRAIALRRAVAL